MSRRQEHVIMNIAINCMNALKTQLRWKRSISLLLMVVLSAGACGDDGLDKKSVLKTYRVIAIKADPPALTLNEPTEITLFDFHPQDLSASGRPAVDYQLTLCPFSLGSVTQYECLFDEVSLDDLIHVSMEREEEGLDEVNRENSEAQSGGVRPQPNLTLKMTASDLLELLGDDLQTQLDQLEMGADMLGSEMSFFDAGQIDLYVKLLVKIEGEPDFSAVKSIPLILTSDIEVNQNPTLTGVSADQLKDMVSEGDELKLRAVFSSSSAETYTPPLSAEAESQDQEATEKTETLLFSWYTTSGSFDKPLRLQEDTSTTLTLGEESGPQRLYLTLRDGRGGVDLMMINFDITPQP